MNSASLPNPCTFIVRFFYCFYKSFIINNIKVVEAAGVEPASENVTGEENYMRSPVHALGITRGRSRLALRTDKKRVPLA